MRENTITIEFNNHMLSLSLFHKVLLEWGIANKRLFPWRLTTDPFHILIAELMLRRTHARQVVPVYNRFIAQYPDAWILAQAAPDDVARILYTLGMAWRVPAFQQIAGMLVERYEGKVPSSYQELRALPGIGDYVASAIACFAFGHPLPIVDTNTVRVAGRLFKLPLHAESRRTQRFRFLLSDLMDYHQPQSYNYALLDIAALICLPRNPACRTCPLFSQCSTGQSLKLEALS